MRNNFILRIPQKKIILAQLLLTSINRLESKFNAVISKKSIIIEMFQLIEDFPASSIALNTTHLRSS